MLSPGLRHQRIPRELIANLKARKLILERAKNDAVLQAGLKEACRQDILFFINLFVWQFNPNAIGRGSLVMGPFITWDLQDRALLKQPDVPWGPEDDSPEDAGILWCLENQEDLVIVKSREMGASYLCLLVILWLFLFHPWRKMLLISRNQEAVYRSGDSDSLFWKMDFIIEHLPDWMKPGDLKKRKLTYNNPLTKSSVTGQATTGKAGVGGRASLIFFDEFSQIDQAFEMLSKTASTSNCRIFNGTHTGTDTAFYKLTDTTSVVGGYIKKLHMHWTQHPDKRRGLYRFNTAANRVEVLDKQFAYPADYQFVMEAKPTGGPYPCVRSPWYDKKCRDIASERGVAMDLDIDAAGSVSQVFDSLLIRMLKDQYALPAFWRGDVLFDPDTGQPDGLLDRAGGPLELWLTPDRNNKLPIGKYAGGADVSTGSGTTNSILSFVDARTGEKVAQYASPNVDAYDLAAIMAAIGYLLVDEGGTPALLAWEIPGPGLTFGKRLLELGYPNYYQRESNDEIPGSRTTPHPGWVNNQKTKPVLIYEYAAALKARQFVNRCEKSLDECLKFKYDPSGRPVHAGEISKDDPTGARENHGDRVMADGIAWKMVKLLGYGTAKVEAKEEIKQGSLLWRRMKIAAQYQREEDWL